MNGPPEVVADRSRFPSRSRTPRTGFGRSREGGPNGFVLQNHISRKTGAWGVRILSFRRKRAGRGWVRFQKRTQNWVRFGFVFRHGPPPIGRESRRKIPPPRSSRPHAPMIFSEGNARESPGPDAPTLIRSFSRRIAGCHGWATHQGHPARRRPGGKLGLPSFPSSAWECRPRRSASVSPVGRNPCLGGCRSRTRRSLEDGIPTRSMGPSFCPILRVLHVSAGNPPARRFTRRAHRSAE